MTRYRTRMPHIDHMRRLNIDPGLAAYPPNMLFNLYANLHVHLAVITMQEISSEL